MLMTASSPTVGTCPNDHMAGLSKSPLTAAFQVFWTLNNRRDSSNSIAQRAASQINEPEVRRDLRFVRPREIRLDCIVLPFQSIQRRSYWRIGNGSGAYPMLQATLPAFAACAV